MAAKSNLYFPQLRKQDFRIIKHSGGVPEALRQHREAVAHLLGSDEPAYWYAETSLDLPGSPGLPSIFDFPDPVFPAAEPDELALSEAEEGWAGESIEESSEDDDESVPPPLAPPAPASPPSTLPSAVDPTAAERDGTDEATRRLIAELSAGVRRSSRAPGLPKANPHKRTRCADEADSSPEPGDDDDDDDDDTPSPPPAKKQRQAPPAAPASTIPGPAAAPQPTPPAPPPPPAPRPRTEIGDLVGTPLPAAVAATVASISAMPPLSTGYPSRNKLRKASQTLREISRKSGYLMTVRRGGSLRRWFGDEAVFGMEMWRWLVGEQEE